MTKRMSKPGTTAAYAGSFDPVTHGHLDVIQRAAKLFERVIVGVGTARQKQPLFSAEERVQMIVESCRKLTNVTAVIFDGLAVDFARSHDATCLVRGLRTEVDFTYETQMALMNRTLERKLETIFIPTAQEFGHISSSLVKEVATFGGDISTMVPTPVAKALVRRLKKLP